MPDLNWTALMPLPNHPVLSMVLDFLGVTLILWMARNPVENLVRRVFVAMANAIRLGARWLDRHANSLHQRANALAIEYFLAGKERDIEGGMRKIGDIAHRGLSRFPDTNHRIHELINRHDLAFEAAQEPKPAPAPDTRKLDRRIEEASAENSLTVKELRALRRTVEKEYNRRLKLVARESRGRMRRLKRLHTPIHRLKKTLAKVDAMFSGLQKRIEGVENAIVEYRQIRTSEKEAERAANHSILTRFMVGAFVMAIIVGGAFVNFLLIQRPMAEMIGGGYIGGFPLATVGAMTILLVEIGAGIVFMESWGASRLLPQFEAMEPDTRRKLAVTMGLLLLAMACVEAGLAILREQLIAADAQTVALLTGQQPETAETLMGGLPVVVQAGLGFVIPLILAAAAIPLDTLFNTTRIVAQKLLCVLMWAAAGLLRLLGAVLHGLYRMLVAFYELLIFFWLFIEQIVAPLFARSREERA